ncbi:hypothetical protein M5D96_005573, partial [Drosophila gunungcola]
RRRTSRTPTMIDQHHKTSHKSEKIDHHHKSSRRSEKRRSDKPYKVKSHDPLKKQKKRALKKLRRKAANELKRSSTDFSYLRLSKAKIVLTSQLIAKKMGTCNPLSSVEELKELSREVQFQKRLCHQVERLQQFRQLGLTEMILNGKKTILTTTSKPKSSPTAKSSSQAHEIEEEDYNFHNDRLPALSEDEYNNLGEDANPLHFLKQQPLDLEKEVPQQQPSQQIKVQPDSPVVTPQPVGSPIFITIPIYISTGGKLPLTLTIGDQELSLRKASGAGSSMRNPSTKAPNSHFNRLLQQIESPRRRTTNRHRSQLKSHIYAMQERKEGKDLVHHPMQ